MDLLKCNLPARKWAISGCVATATFPGEKIFIRTQCWDCVFMWGCRRLSVKGFNRSLRMLKCGCSSGFHSNGQSWLQKQDGCCFVLGEQYLSFGVILFGWTDMENMGYGTKSIVELLSETLPTADFQMNLEVILTNINSSKWIILEPKFYWTLHEISWYYPTSTSPRLMFL